MSDGCMRDHSLFNYFRLTGEQLDELRQQGFLALGRTLTGQGLAAVREAVAESKQTDLHEHSELVRRYCLAGPLLEVARQIIGPSARVDAMQLLVHHRGQDAMGWRRDRSLTCLTALDDLDERTGRPRVIPLSHTHATADEPQSVTVPLRGGECLLLHSDLLYGCEVNRSSDCDQRVLYMRFAAD